ncbi:hypothetical protein CFBP498_31060 [Xanthomonas hortorum pv. vitians]|uniref:Uncharacterized protein n=1 Tax=Xanthomonas hortorum pv. vitians TaxID=83224 RepID=A0A6V7E3V7_9XANT|nr:hypothetical protein [Xanthomonas hortorum]MDT7825925.1 hypothetical protein [Xanthomonas hortorum pv. vitians]CAD0345710.1 hypothetical protein CFBP498_31060 [Xanthomonas hortorum pv. vitians]CAD0345717.1 hypothetical protein CFBP498_31060 [Xanthomonas hortorum pv. vitians]
MKEKYWPDHLAKGFIGIDDAQFSLAHLQPFTYQVIIATPDRAAVAVSVSVEFSSHYVSKGPPKQGPALVFHAGHDDLVIDQRRIWRCFHPARYAASALLPDIMRTLDQRPCLFTNGDNFLTMELQELIPGDPPGAQYEVYFNVAARGRGTVRIYAESAYVRDEDADNDPYKFKKDDRIKGWRQLPGLPRTRKAARATRAIP